MKNKVKLILIGAILFTLQIPVLAQYNNKKHIEVELNFGSNKTYKNNSITTYNKFISVIELRYNFTNSPFDMGLSWLSNSGTIKENNKDANYKFNNLFIVSDYNIRTSDHFALFAGIGVSPIIWITGTSDKKTSVKFNKFIFMPRVGFEFLNRLRLTIGYKYINKNNTGLFTTFGFVFGGGYKR